MIDPAAFVRDPRARRWGFRVLAFVALLGVFGFLLVPPILNSVLTARLGEVLHREVSIGSIRFNPYTLTVTVEKLSVRDKESGEVFGFDSLKVNAEMSSLAVAGIVIKEVELSGPRVNLVRTAENRYNISDLVEEWFAGPKRDAPLPRFSVSNIQIRDGRIDFDDRPEGVRHQVSNIALGVPFVSSLPFHAETFVEPLFSAMVNDAPLVLAGKSRPFADSRESEISLDLDGLKLARYLTYLPVELPIRVASGELDGKLHVRFVQHRDKPLSLSLDGRLAINDLRLDEASGGRLLAFSQAEVRLREIDVIGRRIAVEAVTLRNPEVDARINGDGAINWQALVPSSAVAADATQARGGRSNEPESWRVSVDEVLVRKAALALADTGEQVQLGEIGASGVAVDVGKRTLSVRESVLKDGSIRLQRNAKGGFAWLRGGATAATSSAGETPAPWLWEVGRLRLTGYMLQFEDRGVSPAATQTLEIAQLDVDNLSPAADATASLAAKLRINRKGELSFDGTVQPAGSAGELTMAAKGLELLPLQPYFGDRLNIVITRGQVAANGKFRFFPAKEGLGVTYAGDLTLGNFASMDKANSDDFLKWRSFYFGGMEIGVNPLSVSIGEVALADFYSRLIVSADGKLNLLQVVKREMSGEAASAGAKASMAEASVETPTVQTPAPGVEAVPVKIGKVTLQGGNVNLTDNFIKPNYSANLTKIGGRISGMSSAEGSVADLELRGSYNDHAPLNVTAKLNPFAARSFLDLDAEVKGVELTSFSTYAGKYAGYEIEKGKLSLFLKYRIENKQLSADNRIFLDQLTFGDPVESASATKLPVNLAVSLLKNRAGEIDINLPISGSLDDPEFSLGGIIGQVIVNLLVKAVTSPFALLGSLFGGGEELAYVEFEYGYDNISDSMRERLANLAKVLEERPAVDVSVAGRIDPERDREGLKRATLERRVRAQKLADQVKKGIEVDGEADVKIEPTEYPLYLERAYKAEKFPKPRNIIGLVKDLPVEEMEKLMIANMPSDDEALRALANRRADAVANWLVNQGKIPADRVFHVKPHMTPAEGPQNDKARDSRVDFLLK